MKNELTDIVLADNSLSDIEADSIFNATYSCMDPKEASRLKSYIAKIRDGNRFDGLTGLRRGDFLKGDFEKAYAMFDRSGIPFAIMFADVDNFKGINDKYGHPAGDSVLKEIAERISEGGRTTDSFYRRGGDEFAAIYSGVNLTGAILAAQNAVNRVSDSPIDIGDGKSVNTSISSGVYVVKEGDSFKDAYEAVDAIMYNAKYTGKNSVSF